jgi:hypothetical protein
MQIEGQLWARAVGKGHLDRHDTINILVNCLDFHLVKNVTEFVVNHCRTVTTQETMRLTMKNNFWNILKSSRHFFDDNFIMKRVGGHMVTVWNVATLKIIISNIYNQIVFPKRGAANENTKK